MSREERGGGGLWNPKICVPKMAQINISFFPTMNLSPGGVPGGGVSSCGCQPFQYILGARGGGGLHTFWASVVDHDCRDGSGTSGAYMRSLPGSLMVAAVGGAVVGECGGDCGFAFMISRNSVWPLSFIRSVAQLWVLALLAPTHEICRVSGHAGVGGLSTRGAGGIQPSG